MQSLGKKDARKPEVKKGLNRQLDVVKPGVYYVLYIYRPNPMYTYATVRTDSFSVYEKVEDWDEIKQPLKEGIKNKKFIAIGFDGRNYEYLLLDKPPEPIKYDMLENGIKLTYPEGFVTHTEKEPEFPSYQGKETVLEDCL